MIEAETEERDYGFGGGDDVVTGGGFDEKKAIDIFGENEFKADEILVSDEKYFSKTTIPQRLFLWTLDQSREQAILIETFNDVCALHVESVILFLTQKNDIFPADFSSFPQDLRLVYLIENIYGSICGKGRMKCYLVFINSFEYLLSKYGSHIWLFRQLFLLHCQANPTKFDYIVIDDWSSESYTEILREKKISVMILHDGCSVNSRNAAALPSQMPDVSAEITEEDDNRTDEEREESDKMMMVTMSFVLPCCLIWASLRSDVGVAFLYKFCAGKRVAAESIRPVRVPVVIADDCSLVADYVNYELQELKSDESAEMQLTIAKANTFFSENNKCLNFKPNSEGFNFNWKPGFRSLLYSFFYRQIKAHEIDEPEMYLTFELFVKYLILCDVLLQNLHIVDRIHGRASPDIEDVLDVIEVPLDAFFSYCSAYIKSFVKEIFDDSHHLNLSDVCEDTTQFADFLDAEFLRTLITISLINKEPDIGSEFFGLSDPINSNIEIFWKHLSGKDFFPINTRPFRESLDVDCLRGPDEAEATIIPDPCLLPIDHVLINRIVLSEDGSVEGNSLPRTLVIEDESANGDAAGNSAESQMLIEAEVSTDKPGLFSLETIFEDSRTGQFMKRIEYLRKNGKWYQSATENRSQEYIKNYNEKLKDKWRMKEILETRAAITALFGFNRYHFNIVPQASAHIWRDSGVIDVIGADKLDKKLKKAPSGKRSNKALQIIEKNINIKQIAEKEKAVENLPTFERSLRYLQTKTDFEEFTYELIEMTVGHPFVESFYDFPKIKSILREDDVVVNCILKIAIAILDFQMTWNSKSIDIGLEKDMRLATFTICVVFRFVHDFYDLYPDYIRGEMIVLMQKILLGIGFEQSALNLFENWKQRSIEVAEMLNKEKKSDVVFVIPKSKKKGSKSDQAAAKISKPMHSKRQASEDVVGRDLEQFRVVDDYNICGIRISKNREMDYQMRYMGPFMKRSTDSKEDVKKRVRFRPDAWQMKLLDIVDRRESALVLAPTGSGKTFICYYAMDLTLRLDDESVVVYVAPTKALMNQVKLEVRGRFQSKNYSNKNRILVGSALPEEYCDIERCQILLIIPSLFDQMLIESYEFWASKIKYVIFDEIHCIAGDNEMSVDLERLIHFIPCPFLAMSATLGNPERFYGWLKSATVPATNKIHFLQFNERYSDLNTLVYFDDTESLYSVNPLSCLDYAQCMQGSIDRISLSPKDAIDVYTVVSDILKNSLAMIDENIRVIESHDEIEMDSKILFWIKKMKLNDHLLNTSSKTLPLLDGSVLEVSASVHDTLHLLLESENNTLEMHLHGKTFEAVEEQLNATMKHLITDIKQFEVFFDPDYYFSAAPSISKRMTRFYWHTMKHFIKILLQCRILNKSAFELLCRQIQEQSQVDRPLLSFSIEFSEGTLKENQDDQVNEIKENELKEKEIKENEIKDIKVVEVVREIPSPLSEAEPRDPYDSFNKLQTSQMFLKTDKFYAMLRQIEKADMLPTIVFNFNTDYLGIMARSLCERLAADHWWHYYGTEEKKKITSNIDKKRMDEWKATIKNLELMQKLKTLSREEKELQGIKEEDIMMSDEKPPMPVSISEEHNDNFSFANVQVCGVYGEWITKRLAAIEKLCNNRRLAPWFYQAIKRGIGVHHERCNRAYREAVEALFRLKYLKVVFASGTLALGIQMPCKSVVFTGDAIDLTSLMFRQMSGRAGRRGFDNKGSVILWNISSNRIKQLLSAELPMIIGDLPTSPSLVLRFMSSVGKLSNSLSRVGKQKGKMSKNMIIDPIVDSFIESIAKTCGHPLYSIGEQNHEDNDTIRREIYFELKYYLRFIVDFLRRVGVIDRFGQGLHYHEMLLHTFRDMPFSIILFKMLPQIVERVTEMRSEKQNRQAGCEIETKTKEYTLVILAYCLNRIPISEREVVRLQDERARDTAAFELSIWSEFSPCLPPLGDEMQSYVHDFYDLTLKTHLNMQLSLSRTKPFGLSDYRLPQSLQQYIGRDGKMIKDKLIYEAQKDDSQLPQFWSFYKNILQVNTLRSPFYSLHFSRDDTCRSCDDLEFGIRGHIHCRNVMPKIVMREAIEISDSSTPVKDKKLPRHFNLVNAYVLDFYRHKKYKLLKYNGLFGKHAYFALFEFLRKLKAFMRFMMTYHFPKPLWDDVTKIIENTEELRKQTQTISKNPIQYFFCVVAEIFLELDDAFRQERA